MDTILLLMEKTRDRRLLEEHLQSKYALITPTPGVGLDMTFDLCITDGPALSRYRNQLAARWSANTEVHQPVQRTAEDPSSPEAIFDQGIGGKDRDGAGKCLS